MNGYQQRTEEKKQQILRTASLLFKQNGLENVSIRDIAKHAGVAHATIYNHFGNINTIIRHFIQTEALSILEELKETINSDKPLEEKLGYFIFRREEVIAGLNRNRMITLISTDPDLAEFVLSVWKKEIDSIIEGLLDQGIRDGYVISDVSKETILSYIKIVREGLLTSGYHQEDQTLRSQTFRELHYLVLRGILKNDFANTILNNVNRRDI